MPNTPTPADVERASQICLAIRENKGLSDFSIIYSALAAERQSAMERACRVKCRYCRDISPALADNYGLYIHDIHGEEIECRASDIRAEFAREGK